MYEYYLNPKNERGHYISLIADRNPSRSRPPHQPLDLMRVNHQLHDEVTKALYEHRRLFLRITRDKESRTLSDEFMSRYYETLAQMAPRTREMFSNVELLISPFSSHDFMARRYQLAPPNTDHMRGVFDLLPNLSTFNITLPDLSGYRHRAAHAARDMKQVCDTLEWLLDYIPLGADILWNLRPVKWYPHPQSDEEKRMMQFIESRGSVKAIYIKPKEEPEYPRPLKE